MTTPSVSVIVPAYNAEQFIADALSSVRAQVYSRVECIVVDDGSSDGTAAIVHRSPDVRYLYQANRGVAAARNLGAAAAKGEYLAFLDADDLWLPEKVGRQAAALAANSDVAMVHCGIVVTDSGLVPVAVRPCATSRRQALERAVRLFPPAIYSTTLMIRRDVFEVMGGYDENLSTSADTDLACRVAMAYPIIGLPDPLVRYRQHPTQMHRNLGVLEADVSRVHQKVFETPPEWMRVTRRQAQAALDLTLAIGYISGGELPTGIRYLARATRTHPAEVGTRIGALLGSRLRQATTDREHET